MASFLLHPTEILILLFILLTFVFSGVEKIVDWKGQIVWLKAHFKDTFLVPILPLLLGVLVLLDLVVSTLSILALIFILQFQELTIGLYTCILAAIVLLFLLFGQRMAKDFQGAFTIVGYFIVVVFGVWLFSR
ncbi:MAG: hypothetical protein ACI828_001328 [Flavobacteriales bacterium]|jgi:hypothetical protein